jgi:hypothetical protein
VKTLHDTGSSSITFEAKSTNMKTIQTEEYQEEPLFDLPLENELLLMKLKAEFGAECTTGSEQIPPAIVNEFLKSVYEFERKFREPRPTVTIFEKTGMPLFTRIEDIKEKHIAGELKRIQNVLIAHSVELEILGNYDDRTIYRFITEEFFDHEMEDLSLPGYVHHFCYEDFHPNHEIDIRQRSVEFLSQWFAKEVNEYSWELADHFVHPDTRQFLKEEVLEKISNVFNDYQAFFNCEYIINKLTFEWSDSKECGNGFVEGEVRYDARLQDGSMIHVQGPFQFYMSNTCNWWSIFYFVFPEFNWNN